MSAAPSVRKGTGSFALMQALRMAGSFAVAALVARQLGADGKGLLAVVQQAPSLVSLVMGFGFAGVNVYYVGSGRKTASEALGDSLVVSALALLLGVPVAAYALWAIPAARSLAPAVIWASAAIVPVSVLTAQVAGVLIGQGRPERQAWAQSFAAVSNVAIVGALYMLVRLSVGAAVAVNLLTSVISLVLMLLWLGQPAHLAGSVARLRDAFNYARRRYLADVASMLEMRLDIVMLGVLATAAATGVYSVAVAVVELLWFIPRAAETPLLSRFLHSSPQEGVGLVAISVRLTVVLQAIMLIGASLLLKPAIALVFGPAFDGASLLFWILAPGVVANGLVGPLISYLTARGHLFPALSAGTVIANVLLNALLIPTMGAGGAALASSVTYAAGSAWLVWRFSVETGCGPRELFIPRLSDLRVLLMREDRTQR